MWSQQHRQCLSPRSCGKPGWQRLLAPLPHHWELCLTMTPITLRNIVKHFGSTAAVDGVDIDIPAGSLFFLLGPSGCGKTTLLRMMAGFTDVTAGTIRFGDQDVTYTQPSKRNTGMVFQGYALWPHMTVYQNVAFGLDVRKISREDKAKRVEKALKGVQMEEYAQRRPNQLSGGQQQRVALARALVIEPTVLLLDEPLSNLDAKLRLEMREEIKRICKQANITAVYVTHDQDEALSMADGIAVLSKGKLVQVGAPRELYHRPRNRFVADFLGETNFISAQIVKREGDAVTLECPAGQFTSTVFTNDLPATGNVTCSVRPEAVRMLDRDPTLPGETLNTFNAKRKRVIYLGAMAQHQFILDDSVRMKVFELNPAAHDESSDEVTLGFAPEDVVILQD